MSRTKGSKNKHIPFVSAQAEAALVQSKKDEENGDTICLPEDKELSEVLLDPKFVDDMNDPKSNGYCNRTSFLEVFPELGDTNVETETDKEFMARVRIAMKQRRKLCEDEELSDVLVSKTISESVPDQKIDTLEPESKCESDCNKECESCKSNYDRYTMSQEYTDLHFKTRDMVDDLKTERFESPTKENLEKLREYLRFVQERYMGEQEKILSATDLTQGDKERLLHFQTCEKIHYKKLINRRMDMWNRANKLKKLEYFLTAIILISLGYFVWRIFSK